MDQTSRDLVSAQSYPNSGACQVVSGGTVNLHSITEQLVCYVVTRRQIQFYTNTRIEFLEQTGILKYPPPLYAYGWKDLKKDERKTALRLLQEQNKAYVHAALEAKNEPKVSLSEGKSWEKK